MANLKSKSIKNKAQESNGPKPAPVDSPAIEPRTSTGNAALARRAAGPG